MTGRELATNNMRKQLVAAGIKLDQSHPVVTPAAGAVHEIKAATAAASAASMRAELARAGLRPAR